MDYLSSAIQNLSPKETTLLLQRIKTQKIKFQLYTNILQSPDIDNKSLSTALNYNDNLTSFYTLKNRLLDDIISVKIELNKNEVTRVKEKIQNLRLLVYSKDRYSLIRELKKLEKTCIHLELFNELKEVYFCFFLTYRHDSKKSAMYLKIQESVERKQQLTNKLEEIFYSTVLDCQDLFYLPNRYAYDKVHTQLVKIKEIHDILNNKTSAFFYLSGELTLKLSCFYSSVHREEALKELNQLFKIYNYSFLIYKYPNCDVAIQCLYSRYYQLNDEHDKFRQVQKDIFEKITKVKGYQMFDCSFFYFIYVTVLQYIENKDHDKVVDLIEEMISEDYINVVSARLRNHFLYLLAVKEYYQGNYDKCSAILLRSRNLFTNLDIMSSWVCVENILLNLYCCLLTSDYRMLESEITFFKRMLRKFHYDDKYHTLSHSLLKVMRQYESGQKNLDSLITSIQQLRKDFGFFRLIQPATASLMLQT